MTRSKKSRLDAVLVARHPHLSKSYVQSLIMQGKVMVDGQIITKAGTPVSDEAVIIIEDHKPRYVSRAGLKLEKALAEFGIDVTDCVVLDAGLSTGGFTDCLLQHGARKVYGVDVGYGQVHETIRQDPRVVVMEKTNLRHLEQLPEQVDMATLDLSFISLTKIINVVISLLKPGGSVVALIKPQFEVQKHEVGKGGIVRDPAKHQEVLDRIEEAFAHAGLICKGIISSPIEGAMGNKEFLGYFVKTA